MQNKNELSQLNCSALYKCVFSSCCTLEIFQEQIYQVNLFSILIFFFLSSIFSYKIMTSKRQHPIRKEDDNKKFNFSLNRSNSYYFTNRSFGREDVNLNMSMSFTQNRYLSQHVIGEKRADSSYSNFKIIPMVFIKMFILQQILMKFIEIIYINNHFIIGDIEMYSFESITEDQSSFMSDLVFIKISSVIIIEVLLLIFSFSLFYIGGQFLEFYKKYLINSLIYLGFFLYNFTVYWTKSLIMFKSYLISSFVCLFILILLLFISIYSNSIFFAKLNREDSVSEVNYHKEIIQNYSKNLSEDDRELYKETNRVFDMYKVLEIIEKIRLNRKQIWNIGLILLFVIFVICIIFNFVMFIRNFKISYLYTENTIKSNDIANLNNVDYFSDYNVRSIKKEIIGQRVSKGNYPSNLLLVMLSNVDLHNLEMNEEYLEFVDLITTKEQSGRVYKIKTDRGIIPNWISYFTGTKTELNGVKGNILKSTRIGKFDSIFKRMKRNGVSDAIISSPFLDVFLRNSIPDATLVNYLSDISFVNKLEHENSLKYYDEKRFQEILKTLSLHQEKYNVRKHINSLESKKVKNIPFENFYINSFMMVHFTELNKVQAKDYQNTLTEKIHYIKKLYKAIDDNTVLMILSDSQKNEDAFLPLIVAKKESKFADNDFSLYLNSNTAVFEPADVASTICSILSIEIPRDNQGKLIDEVVELSNFTEDEKKLAYLDYREQQQRITLKLLDFFSENTQQKFTKEYDDVNILYRPPDTTSPEFYYTEANNFKEIFTHVYEEVYSRELSKNIIYSICICIFVIFFTMLVSQYLTYADLVAVFSLSESGKRNSISFLSALLVFSIYYSFNLLILNKVLFNQKKISEDFFLIEFVSFYILIPLIFALFIQKIWFSLFYYAIRIQSETYPQEVGYMNFFFTNLMRGVNNAIYTQNGLAYVYLFRVYSVIITVCLSLIMFFNYNQYSFLFSSSKIVSFLVYREDNFHKLRFSNENLILILTYQFSLFICFYAYPTFNKVKQIFDSIFELYDLKLIETLEAGKTCEKDAFNSEFVLDFVNFDNQSEWYYRKKHFDIEAKYPNFTDKFCSAMILSNILNTSFNLTDIENNVRLENIMMGREQIVTNDLRRSGFGRSNFNLY